MIDAIAALAHTMWSKQPLCSFGQRPHGPPFPDGERATRPCHFILMEKRLTDP